MLEDKLRKSLKNAIITGVVGIGSILSVNESVNGSVMRFRNGLNGYEGVKDTFIDEFQPNEYLGDSVVNWISGEEDNRKQGLLKFESIFGDGEGQIPLGSEINSAHVRVMFNRSFLEPREEVEVYRMKEGSLWNEESNWNSFIMNGGGLQRNIEVGGEPSARIKIMDIWEDGKGYEGEWKEYEIDVSEDLRVWSQGKRNNGWAFLQKDGTGSTFIFTDNAGDNFNDNGLRPELYVNYDVVPEPRTISLIGIGLGLLFYRNKK